jgi:hypothetical protein
MHAAALRAISLLYRGSGVLDGSPLRSLGSRLRRENEPDYDFFRNES